MALVNRVASLSLNLIVFVAIEKTLKRENIQIKGPMDTFLKFKNSKLHKFEVEVIRSE